MFYNAAAANPRQLCEQDSSAAGKSNVATRAPPQQAHQMLIQSARLSRVQLWTEDDQRVAWLAGDHALRAPGAHRSARQGDLFQMSGCLGQQGLLVVRADGAYIVLLARLQFLQNGLGASPRNEHQRQLLGWNARARSGLRKAAKVRMAERASALTRCAKGSCVSWSTTRASPSCRRSWRPCFLCPRYGSFGFALVLAMEVVKFVVS
jgi:hypothetical protein